MRAALTPGPRGAHDLDARADASASASSSSGIADAARGSPSGPTSRSTSATRDAASSSSWSGGHRRARRRQEPVSAGPDGTWPPLHNPVSATALDASRRILTGSRGPRPRTVEIARSVPLAVHGLHTPSPAPFALLKGSARAALAGITLVWFEGRRRRTPYAKRPAPLTPMTGTGRPK